MLKGDMDLARIMIYMQQVEEDKLKYTKGFKNKRSKTEVNYLRAQKGSTNSSFQQKKKRHALPSASAIALRNKGEHSG